MQPAAIQVTEVVALNDAKRVREARAGDVRAFEAIARAALPGAYRLASAILGSEAEAADATQNALVAAWRELPRLREVGELRAAGSTGSSSTSAGCRCGGEAGATRSRWTTTRPWTAAVKRWPRPRCDRVEVMDLLEGAFEELDPDDRAMVVMHHLEDRPLAEIAACMHMPVGTVKWRLHEARQTLQRALEGLG